MPPTPHVSKIPINKTTKSDDVFLSICKNIYFYSYAAVRLTLSTFYTWYSLQVFLFFPEVGRTGYHGSTSGPNVLLNSNFHPLLFYTSDFWGDFFMFFCIVFYVLSIFSPHSSCHHFSQFIPLSLLYGKTFLMLYSASVKPGAYFLCPKLIANVRRDPSPHPRQHLLPFWH